MPEALNQEEFFEGVSIPRNKELMRVFKDVDLVEQLGSGVPRILQSYGRECFKFMPNFLRMTFNKESGQIGGQIGGQIELLTDRQQEILQLILLNNKISRKQISDRLKINESAVQKHLKALTELKIIERIGTNKGYWQILIKK